MLRTNLASRPFYNVRAVQAALAAGVLIVLAATLFNVVQYVRLSASQETLGASAEQAEDEATRLRGDAARIRSQIDPKELEVVAAAAREANAVIDQRTFSWTELFEQFEATLPANVRITSVQPTLDKREALVIAVQVQARRVEDLDAFIEALEAQGSFRDVLAVQEQTTDEGLIEAVVQGGYVPPSRGAAPEGGATGAGVAAGTADGAAAADAAGTAPAVEGRQP